MKKYIYMYSYIIKVGSMLYYKLFLFILFVYILYILIVYLKLVYYVCLLRNINN